MSDKKNERFVWVFITLVSFTLFILLSSALFYKTKSVFTDANAVECQKIIQSIENMAGSYGLENQPITVDSSVVNNNFDSIETIIRKFESEQVYKYENGELLPKATIVERSRDFCREIEDAKADVPQETYSQDFLCWISRKSFLNTEELYRFFTGYSKTGIVLIDIFAVLFVLRTLVYPSVVEMIRIFKD